MLQHPALADVPSGDATLQRCVARMGTAIVHHRAAARWYACNPYQHVWTHHDMFEHHLICAERPIDMLDTMDVFWPNFGPTSVAPQPLHVSTTI